MSIAETTSISPASRLTPTAETLRKTSVGAANCVLSCGVEDVLNRPAESDHVEMEACRFRLVHSFRPGGAGKDNSGWMQLWSTTTRSPEQAIMHQSGTTHLSSSKPHCLNFSIAPPPPPTSKLPGTDQSRHTTRHFKSRAGS